MQKQKIVFFGTPDFAVPSLELLITRKETIAAVVTQPDRPVGRGQKLKFSPIKKLARESGLTVLQPEKAGSPDFIEVLKALSPDLAVVVAYGQIFPKALLKIPKNGFINVHSSLLPRYRGAAPINRAIINGDTETGVTIMQLDEGMDTGDILLQEKIKIDSCENAASLHDRLAMSGAILLGRSLDLLKQNRWRPVAQNHEEATYATMLKKEDGRIDWHLPADILYNRIRGMTPWPGCFTHLDKKLFKIHSAEKTDTKHEALPGQVLSVSDNGIAVAAGKGALLLKEVQLEGKKRMSASDFIKGHQIGPGTVLKTKQHN